MKSLRILSAIMLGAAVSLSACDAPLQASPSGLIVLPSTDIFDRGVLHLDLDGTVFPRVAREVDDVTGEVLSRQADGIATVGLTYGFGPGHSGLFGRSEVGVEYDAASLSGIPNNGRERFNYNFKTQLFESPRGDVRVVAGGTQLGHKSVFARLGYVTASKNFGDAGRVHAGVYHIFNSVPGNRNSLQFAYEKFFGDRLHFIVETNTDTTGTIGRNPLGSTALSAVYYLNSHSDVQIAVGRPNTSAVREGAGNYFIYIGYDFTLKAPNTRTDAAPPSATPATP